MTIAELTTILQQVTAQMSSDHGWFATLQADIDDHATRLDKIAMIGVTNRVNLEKATKDNLKA